MKIKEENNQNAITNQDERLADLTNTGDDKDNYKELFEKLVKEKFNEIKELTGETKYDDSTFILKVILLEKDLMISIMV